MTIGIKTKPMVCLRERGGVYYLVALREIGAGTKGVSIDNRYLVFQRVWFCIQTSNFHFIVFEDKVRPLKGVSAIFLLELWVS